MGPEKAFDGSLDTIFHSRVESESWLMGDLEETYSIVGAAFTSRSSHGGKFLYFLFLSVLL